MLEENSCGGHNVAQPLVVVVEQLLLGSSTLDHVPVVLFLEFQGKYAEAKPLFARTMEIWEKTLGPEHPQVVAAFNNRAGLLQAQVIVMESSWKFLYRVLFKF